MTGSKLAELMIDTDMMRMIAKAARRYTKIVEDQEEYIQDIWIRLAECPDDSSMDHLEVQAQRAVKAAYYRKWRANVHAKKTPNVYGISEDHISNYKRSDLMPLGRNRYLVLTPEKPGCWYYHNEWEEYGLPKDGIQVRSFYKIVVST